MVSCTISHNDVCAHEGHWMDLAVLPLTSVIGRHGELVWPWQATPCYSLECTASDLLSSLFIAQCRICPPPHVFGIVVKQCWSFPSDGVSCAPGSHWVAAVHSQQEGVAIQLLFHIHMLFDVWYCSYMPSYTSILRGDSGDEALLSIGSSSTVHVCFGF